MWEASYMFWPLSTICWEIFNKNLQGGIQQKIFRDVSTKIFRDVSTKIFREVFNKNLQGGIQQKCSGKYSTNIFREIFNKNLLGGIQQRIISVEHLPEDGRKRLKHVVGIPRFIVPNCSVSCWNIYDVQIMKFGWLFSTTFASNVISSVKFLAS
jgi:hypothetical protein